MPQVKYLTEFLLAIGVKQVMHTTAININSWNESECQFSSDAHTSVKRAVCMVKRRATYSSARSSKLRYIRIDTRRNVTADTQVPKSQI
jgi:hypothetical protein